MSAATVATNSDLESIPQLQIVAFRGSMMGKYDDRTRDRSVRLIALLFPCICVRIARLYSGCFAKNCTILFWYFIEKKGGL